MRRNTLTTLAAAGLALAALGACVQPRTSPLVDPDGGSDQPQDQDAGVSVEEQDAPAGADDAEPSRPGQDTAPAPPRPDGGGPPPAPDVRPPPPDLPASCAVSGCPALPNGSVRCTNDRCEYTCTNAAHKKCADGCWECCGLDSDCPAPANPERIPRCIFSRCEEACKEVTCPGSPARCMGVMGACVASWTRPEVGNQGCYSVNICNTPVAYCYDETLFRTATKPLTDTSGVEAACAADLTRMARELCADPIIKERLANGMTAEIKLDAYTFGMTGVSNAHITVGTHTCRP